MAKKRRKAVAYDPTDSIEVARAARDSRIIRLKGQVIYSLSEAGKVRQSMIVRGGEDGPVGYHWNVVHQGKKFTVEEFQRLYEALGCFKTQVHKKPFRINYEKALRVPKQLTPLTKPQLKQVVSILKLRKKGLTYAKVEEKLDMTGTRALLIRAEKLEESVT